MMLQGFKRFSSRVRVYLLAGVSGAAAVGAVQFAQSRADGPPKDQGTPAAANVTVARPTVKPIVEWDEFTGRFTAIDRVEVRARVSGYLESVAFKDGEIVEKGDLLFKVDPRPFEAELAAAEADLSSAAAGLENAKAENERGKRLLAREALSKEEADRRERALKQGVAAHAAAKARVDQAALNLEFTEVRAPITGRISDNYVSEGNLIVGGAQGGTLLTTVVSLDPIYFEFTASEADYLKHVRLANGGAQAGLEGGPSPAFVNLIDESGFSREGEISFVDNQLDPSTGTMRGRATFNNQDGVLAPGMFGRLRLAGSAEYDAILIPDSAVQTDQNEKFVLVADAKDVAARREVELGPVVKGLRVVRSGIDADDRVIVAGAQFVQPGARVAATEADDARFAQNNTK